MKDAFMIFGLAVFALLLDFIILAALGWFIFFCFGIASYFSLRVALIFWLMLFPFNIAILTK